MESTDAGERHLRVCCLAGSRHRQRSVDWHDGPVTPEERLADLYRAFNDRELDAVLAALADDVRWPNAWEGGWLSGRDEVRAYWRRQWQEIDPTVEPVNFDVLGDGRVAVRVRQTVKALDGAPLDEREVLHIYRFHGDVVVEMEVEQPTSG